MHAAGEKEPTKMKSSLKRSAVKALTYRLVIVILDFVAIYVMTGRAKIALGFMVVSNVYTTAAYVAHERIWDKIQWQRGAA